MAASAVGSKPVLLSSGAAPVWGGQGWRPHLGERGGASGRGTVLKHQPGGPQANSTSPGARRALTERLSASAPCWPCRHAVSFLCVLWETCFTSSSRFSTCGQSRGRGPRVRQGQGGRGLDNPGTRLTPVSAETTSNAGEKRRGSQTWRHSANHVVKCLHMSPEKSH